MNIRCGVLITKCSKLLGNPNAIQHPIKLVQRDLNVQNIRWISTINRGFSSSTTKGEVMDIAECVSMR